MRSSRNPRYAPARRCSLSRRLRTRAQTAESRLRRAEAERDAALAHMEELRAAIARERRAMTAFIDSPAFRRDLLVVAQRKLGEEMIRLGSREPERLCRHCLGLPVDEAATVFEDEIRLIERQDSLPPVPHHLPDRWPRRCGLHLQDGPEFTAESLHRRPLPEPPEVPGRPRVLSL